MTITNSKLVIKIDGKNTVNQILDKISQKLVDEGFATSKKSVLDGFKAREKQSTTGLADGIAIPHVSSDAITEAKIVVAKLSEQTDWKALDGQPTDFVIAIAVPANGRNDHFELLTNISGKLADPKFVKEFKKSSNKNIVDTLNNMKSDKPKAAPKKAAKGAVKVVGVTTCVTGVAHTFLAAQALEDEGKKRGWDVKIERQGQMTKNKLTQADIDAAEYVIIGQSKSIDGQERFDGKKVHIVEVAEPITKAGKVFDEMLTDARVQSGKGGAGSSSVKAKAGNEQKQSVMSHMMAGISFMIPYIAMAGIVLGLTTAFGFAVSDPQLSFVFDDVAGKLTPVISSSFGPKNDWALAFNTLAGQGFTLYIPILAMMIANSIAGRKAMAPAAIIALLLNTGIDTTSYISADMLNVTDAMLADALVGLQIPASGLMVGSEMFFNVADIPTTVDALAELGVTFSNGTGGVASTAMQFAPFWNYATNSFQFDATPALGFLGAVASGYLIGYGIKYFTVQTDKIDSMAFQSILPLLLIPILFTTIPFIFFAFVGYLPLYYIGYGLNAFVSLLVDNNLLWIAGGLMGAMVCFDLGGPVNKVAMTIGVLMMSTHPEVNGINALAVSIPPTVLFFSLIGHRFTPLQMDEGDKTSAVSASIMGFFGITEGSIPFAAKDPKKWMPSFMFAGAIGGILITFTGVTDNVAMWGGPIIWAAGGFGSVLGVSSTDPMFLIHAQTTEWVKTLLYFVPLVIAGLSGFGMASLLEWIYAKKAQAAKA